MYAPSSPMYKQGDVNLSPWLLLWGLVEARPAVWGVTPISVDASARFLCKSPQLRSLDLMGFYIMGALMQNMIESIINFTHQE